MTGTPSYRILASSLLFAALTAPSFASECGSVSIARMNWQSAEVLAEVDRFILEHGYGCQAELVPGDTMPTMTSMAERGQPDVAPEMWVNAVREPLNQAVSEGRLHIAAEALPDGGIEGWWIPKYVADAHPEIKTVADALARPDLFRAPENPNVGAVHNCPSGWNCQITTANAFRAWNAEAAGFTLVDTGSAAGLDGSIARAYERQQPWLGYYWSPTAILGRYEMVRLEPDVPFDRAAWDSCNAVTECADPKPNAWPVAEVFTVITTEFRERGGPAIDYLSTRGWSNDVVNALMAWMTDNQATGEDGAIHFLETQPEIWTQWVPADVAERIRAAL